MPTVNLTAGCAIGCVYCYTLGYMSHPGDRNIVLYENIFEKLKREFGRKRRIPRSVFFSPSSDIFQPVAEVLDLAHRVLEFLLSEGVGVAILTKGRVPEATMDLLRQHADKVSVQIGITTLDADVAKVFEPNAATPGARLDQIASLIAGGVSTQARLDPVMPGITDDPENLDRLFSALEAAGVSKSAVGLLFLRPRILRSLKDNVHDRRMLQNILSVYDHSERLAIRAENSGITALPASIREEIFTRVRHIAGNHSINVSICACKNPDLATGTCGIGGSSPMRSSASGVQRRMLV
ncbi:MAG: hypothetical protein CL694_02340 [Chloroflexi bacterium]|jgi:DNA repair photolyase|nr:hypothetical protein [Chloroflexota bacterium]HAL47207.1 hypothetical protein [Dehalococcoidia bacterium]|tara:strand:- start:237 stop:1121 length:885 start_codon:yes stop_codon:yes gene_type:complete